VNGSDTSLLIIPPWVKRFAFLDRLFGLLTSVHAGEGFSAFLLGLNVFLLLSAFYVLKTLREVLILQEGGPEVKSYASAAQSLMLLLLVPAYGFLASRMDRVKLIHSVSLFFIIQLVLFGAAGALGWHVAVAFYLWLGVFNLMVIAQFWAFSTDVYSEDQGRRLFPIVGIGSPLGALFGSWLNGWLFPMLGPWQMMQVAAFLLSLGLVTTWMVNRFVCQCGGPQSVISQLPLGRNGGFQLLLRERYLLLIAFLTLAMNFITTSRDYLMGSLARAESLLHSATQEGQRAWLSGFYSDYFFWTSVAGFLLQTFVAPRFFARYPAAIGLYILPLLTLGGTGIFLLFPVLSIMTAVRGVEGGVEYSLQNTAGHALFLTTSREAKYKAKAAIDAFFWRSGDLIQAGLLWIGAQMVFTLQTYAALQLLVLGAWLWLAWSIVRLQEKRRQRGRWRVME
jgi:ATP:ADP antiporter, AAA family